MSTTRTVLRELWECALDGRTPDGELRERVERMLNVDTKPSELLRARGLATKVVWFYFPGVGRYQRYVELDPELFLDLLEAAEDEWAQDFAGEEVGDALQALAAALAPEQAEGGVALFPRLDREERIGG